MKRKHKIVVVPQIMEDNKIEIEKVVFQKNNKVVINKKKLKKVITSILAIVVIVSIQDASLASGFDSQNEMITVAYQTPNQLKPMLEFVQWLIQLLRLIVSGIAGLICTFAGYKWATAIESNGQESAKKILKNAFIGGLIVWTGTSIADFFVGKMNQILL